MTFTWKGAKQCCRSSGHIVISITSIIIIITIIIIINHHHHHHHVTGKEAKQCCQSSGCHLKLFLMASSLQRFDNMLWASMMLWATSYGILNTFAFAFLPLLTSDGYLLSSVIICYHHHHHHHHHNHDNLLTSDGYLVIWNPAVGGDEPRLYALPWTG